MVALAHFVVIVGGAFDCGGFARVKYSPGNGSTGCRSPHRVRSSTAEELCMS